MPIERARASLAAVAALLIGATSASAQQAPTLRLSLDARAEIVYDAARDKCEPVDVPDVNARAYRARDGGVVMFALHFQARTLRGPDLLHLKIDCHVALESHEIADPAKYDGRRYVTSTWTSDGVNVAALIHNEYHADQHPGVCLFKSDIECWWNSVLAFTSHDGGANFAPSKPLIVASAPFTQDIGQGRHRGFFNPSNMFAMNGYVYALTSTTGWEGQTPGACLIRNRDPMNSAGWRGWDGADFTVTWSDPYAAGGVRLQGACAPLAPFGFPVGSVVRHRGSGDFIALWEAPRIEGKFPTTGFYYATSRDLTHWSLPALLYATQISYEPCGAGQINRDGWIAAYPSLLDADAHGRNFDDVGDSPWIFFSRIRNVGCNPAGQRYLMRQKVSVSPAH